MNSSSLFHILLFIPTHLVNRLNLVNKRALISTFTKSSIGFSSIDINQKISGFSGSKRWNVIVVFYYYEKKKGNSCTLLYMLLRKAQKIRMSNEANKSIFLEFRILSSVNDTIYCNIYAIVPKKIVWLLRFITLSLLFASINQFLDQK